MLSHATHVPVASVNRSIPRTALMCSGTADTVWLMAPWAGVFPPPADPHVGKRKRRVQSAFFRLTPAWLLLLRRLGRALGRGLLPGKVVVRRKRVRREHETLGGNDLRSVGALRLVHLLEERVLGRFLGRHLVPGLHECDQN